MKTRTLAFLELDFSRRLPFLDLDFSHRLTPHISKAGLIPYISTSVAPPIQPLPKTMGRSPCCDESHVKKGPWTPEEDKKLVDYIQLHGHRSWRELPKNAGLNRCGKSCRLRWTNYLRPDIKRGNFSEEEERLIVQLHSALGNK